MAHNVSAGVMRRPQVEPDSQSPPVSRSSTVGSSAQLTPPAAARPNSAAQEVNSEELDTGAVVLSEYAAQNASIAVTAVLRRSDIWRSHFDWQDARPIQAQQKQVIAKVLMCILVCLKEMLRSGIRSSPPDLRLSHNVYV